MIQHVDREEIKSKLFLYSTVMNVATTVVVNWNEEQTEEVENTEVVDMQDRQDIPTSSTASTAPKAKKISQKQQAQNDLTEKISQLAKKEEDQVDLELAAIGAKIKRKLNEEETDEILDEINNVVRQYFARKRRKMDIALVTVQDSESTAAPQDLVTKPPPPLQRQPQIGVQEQIVEEGDILFEMSGPLPNYNLQYVSDPSNNKTYMNLK